MLQYPTDATGRPPGHVRTPADFEYWFHEQWDTRALGADLDATLLDLVGPDGRDNGIYVPRSRARIDWYFLSVTLEWTLAIGADGLFVPGDYSFDFRDGASDELIARYDFHPGHPAIGMAHIHFDDTEDEPRDASEVTFFEAYDAVQEALDLGAIRP